MSRTRDMTPGPSTAIRLTHKRTARKLAAWLAAGVLLPLFACTAAPAQVHPSQPGVNLGDTNFLDGVAGPGWLVEQIVDGYHSTTIADANGRTTTATPAFNVVASLTHVAYLSKHRILRAWWGAEVIPVVADIHASTPGNASGVSTVIASPMNLEWNEWKIGRILVQQSAQLNREREQSFLVSESVLCSHGFPCEALGDKLAHSLLV